MKVCLFYKKLTQKFWVTEVSLVDGVVLDVQTSDCIPRNPNSCVEFKPLDMTEDLSRLVIKHLEEKSSVGGWCLVRPEEEKYHR